jgi:hygromycin-B 7''-O-kinase
MREHLLVDGEGDAVRLSGLFDFEPATIGAAEYEFASVGVFFTGGDASLLRRLLLSYGYGEAALDEAMARRSMTYALLHRYSNLRWYLERVPPRPGVDSLAALARQWFGGA